MAQDRTAPFTAEFVLDRKASVEENDDGQVFIEGYAADWLTDRQDEAFEPGAFESGVKAFLDTNPVLLYHHQQDKALGRVLEAKVEATGLWVKAVVDKPAQGSWAEDVVNKIKTGTIRGFSVGGRFWRRGQPGPGGGPVPGGKIFRTDWTELSVTPSPVGARALFEVAGKAFAEAEPSRDHRAVRAAVTRWLDSAEAALAAGQKAIDRHEAKAKG